MRLSVAIQHHPARPELPPRLLSQLEPTFKPRAVRTSHIEVVEDPNPYYPTSPWRTARECWRRTPAWCTHRLVLQDDVLPCLDALWGVVQALEHEPADDSVVSFYLGQFPTSDLSRHWDACHAGLAWSLLGAEQWVPCVAICLPRRHAQHLAQFELPHHQRDHVADDEVLGEWARIVQPPLWQTLPSLFQHDDDAVSTLGGHTNGMPRRAACFIGKRHPELVDWKRWR